jgi:hypothetical protein
MDAHNGRHTQTRDKSYQESHNAKGDRNPSGICALWLLSHQTLLRRNDLAEEWRESYPLPHLTASYFNPTLPRTKTKANYRLANSNFVWEQ